MMLTHKIIKEEVEVLKDLVLQGESEISPFLKCIWPSLVFVAINYIWDAFATRGNPGFITAASCVLGGFIYVGRMMYLTLPVAFRKDSKTIKAIKNKVAIYGVILVIALFICGLLATTNNWELSSDYNITAFTTYFVLGVVASLDLARYQFSSFVAALTLLKSRKQGGE